MPSLIPRPSLILSLPRVPWLNPCRWVGNRQRLYGEEEGHGVKNEVRKVKAQRKHLIRATGGRWRHLKDLPPDPFKAHGLVSRYKSSSRFEYFLHT